MKKRTPNAEADEAIARLQRIESVVRAQRDLSPDERARVPPHAVLDQDDAAVLLAALKCLRLGTPDFAEALGLAGRWRDRARRRALCVAVSTVPVTSVTPWPRAVEGCRVARQDVVTPMSGEPEYLPVPPGCLIVTIEVGEIIDEMEARGFENCSLDELERVLYHCVMLNPGYQPRFLREEMEPA